MSELRKKTKPGTEEKITKQERKDSEEFPGRQTSE